MFEDNFLRMIECAQELKCSYRLVEGISWCDHIGLMYEDNQVAFLLSSNSQVNMLTKHIDNNINALITR